MKRIVIAALIALSVILPGLTIGPGPVLDVPVVSAEPGCTAGPGSPYRYWHSNLYGWAVVGSAWFQCAPGDDGTRTLTVKIYRNGVLVATLSQIHHWNTGSSSTFVFSSSGCFQNYYKLTGEDGSIHAGWSGTICW